MKLVNKLMGAIQELGRFAGVEIRRSASALGVMEPLLLRMKNMGFKPQLILDIGANTAEWSRLALRIFPEARFILVEPQAELEPHLAAFCESSAGSAYRLAGAGRESGEMELIVWPDFARSSLLFKPGDDVAVERRRIPIITIDSLFEGTHELPQIAKLDIQGFELEALAGASRLFGNTECFIVEVNFFKREPTVPLFADVVAFFDARGYKVYDIPGSMRRTCDGALWQVDLAFVRKGGYFDSRQTW